MKLTLATVAAVLVCLFSLIARSYAMREQRAYLTQERLALDAIDAHLRVKLPALTKR
jgi:hypothetical protein